MDGWWDNVITGAEGPNDDNWYARGSLRWEPTDTLEINAKYEYGDFDRNSRPTVVYQSDFEGQENDFGTVPFPVVSDRDKGAGDVDGSNDNKTDVFAVTVDWELDFATMTSISAYSAYDLETPGNTDLAAVPALARPRRRTTSSTARKSASSHPVARPSTGSPAPITSITSWTSADASTPSISRNRARSVWPAPCTLTRGTPAYPASSTRIPTAGPSSARAPGTTLRRCGFPSGYATARRPRTWTR